MVQGTWLALVRTQAILEDPQAVVRWLTVTARREAWRVSRRSQRQQPAEEEIIQANAGVTPGPEELVVRDHRDQALWDAVRSLPERCQRLLRVVAFADRPDYEQLSRDLGMPVGSIGPTRGRCLGGSTSQILASRRPMRTRSRRRIAVFRLSTWGRPTSRPDTTPTVYISRI